MGQTRIVLISVTKFSDGRYIANNIENMSFESYAEIRASIQKEEKIKEEGDVKIYDLTDFMEDCNDQMIDLDEWWVAYVNIGE